MEILSWSNKRTTCTEISGQLSVTHNRGPTHFAFSGMASHSIFGICVQSTAMNVPGV
jgi:hypothetical protein